MFEQFDAAARRVLEAAWEQATNLGDDSVGTEHLLIALACTDATAARLLAESGVTITELRRGFVEDRGPRRRADHETLLSTLGIDLAEVRQRAEQTFGADAVARAAARARPRRRRRPLRTYISCNRPLPTRRGESTLAGRRPEPIPRVKRLLVRATRAARPQPASPGHLLLALIEGDEPACELLIARGVDLHALAEAARRATDNTTARRWAGRGAVTPAHSQSLGVPAAASRERSKRFSSQSREPTRSTALRTVLPVGCEDSASRRNPCRDRTSA